ncbi:MAG: hypothetical protein LBO80_07895 [Treponema sp.]|jgi:hypothetical protein|nr:hypothetical protein [Treponema sp.]
MRVLLKKAFAPAAAAVLLVAGLVLSGCGDGGGGGGNITVLTITGVSAAQVDEGNTGAMYGLFEPGTARSKVEGVINKVKVSNLAYAATDNIVAGQNTWAELSAVNTVNMGGGSYTTTVLLRDAATGYVAWWNGSGTYDVWIVLVNGLTVKYYKAAGVSIGGSKSIAASDFAPQV